MAQGTPNPNILPSWVEELRNRSWEMELLLAGFVLFGLISVPKHLLATIQSIIAELGHSEIASMAILFIGLSYFAIKILIVNLIAHLALRGYWIGIIGLGSVYPKGVNFDQLNYHPKILAHLKKRIPNFEKLALVLDHVCSSIFSFTFLIFFMIISIGLFLGVLIGGLVFLQFLIGDHELPGFVEVLANVFIIGFLLSGLLVAFDFLSLGLVRKIRWNLFANIYLIIYKVIGWMTFSVFYEPIYYNLISNLSRKKIGIILIGYLVIIFCAFNFTLNEAIFFPKGRSEALKERTVDNQHYIDLLPIDEHINAPTIQSHIIRHEPIQLFLPYKVNDNEAIQKKFPEVTPYHENTVFSYLRIAKTEKTGYGLHIGYAGKKGDLQSKGQPILEMWQKIYSVEIDGTTVEGLKFFFHKHPKQGERGFLVIVPTRDLIEGHHVLTITKNLEAQTSYQIPFFLLEAPNE